MTKYPEAFIIGEKVYFRPFKEGDEIMLARLENHPDPRTTLFYAKPSTIEQQLEKTQKLIDDSNVILFTICDIETSEPIGQTAFHRIDWIGRMAIFYIGIADKENWSKGYGSEATRMMIKYAFDTLNLNRIQLHVAVENEGAVKVYERTGFIIEGTLREAMYHKGQYSDFYVMGVLKSDWERTND
jgi:diamine N-acetyltransferase